MPRPPGLLPYLLAQIVYGLLAMTICLPSMQEWGEIFSTDATRVQLTFSAFVLAYGCSQLLFGPLSDRYGRRPAVLIGLVIAVAGSALAAWAPDVDSLILARLVQGTGCGATMVVGRSLVQDHYSGTERTRVMAFIGMAMGVCPPVATVLGGQLHVWLGWQANPALVAILGAVLLVVALRMLPAGQRSAHAGDKLLAGMIRAYAALSRVRSYVLYVAMLGTTTGAFYTFLAGAPLVLGGFNIGPDGVGFFMMLPPLCYIAGNWLTSRLIRRTGDWRLMLRGQIITVVGVSLMVVLSGMHSAFAFALPAMILGFGHGLLMPPTLSGTVGSVPALAGAAAAAAGLMQQVMGAIGGYAVGWVSTEGSLHISLLIALFTTLGLLAQWGLARDRVNKARLP